MLVIALEVPLSCSTDNRIGMYHSARPLAHEMKTNICGILKAKICFILQAGILKMFKNSKIVALIPNGI